MVDSGHKKKAHRARGAPLCAPLFPLRFVPLDARIHNSQKGRIMATYCLTITTPEGEPVFDGPITVEADSEADIEKKLFEQLEKDPHARVKVEEMIAGAFQDATKGWKFTCTIVL